MLLLQHRDSVRVAVTKRREAAVGGPCRGPSVAAESGGVMLRHGVTPLANRLDVFLRPRPENRWQQLVAALRHLVPAPIRGMQRALDGMLQLHDTETRTTTGED